MKTLVGAVVGGFTTLLVYIALLWLLSFFVELTPKDKQPCAGASRMVQYPVVFASGAAAGFAASALAGVMNFLPV